MLVAFVVVVVALFLTTRPPLMERAIALAAAPVVRVSGDELRLLSVDELIVCVAGAATVVLGGTGWSHISEALTADQPDVVVLDPLAVALTTACHSSATQRNRKGEVTPFDPSRPASSAR